MTTRPTSNEYWLQRAGNEYEAQQKIRTAAGNEAYAKQERWLLDYFAQRSRDLGRRIRVLDFGCGFGRFARLLADSEVVDYYGYDFSTAMAESLLENPPAQLQPISDRVRIAPTLAEAFSNERFDIVFTVSVLVHNPPEMARALLEGMVAHLVPDGRVVLVENALSALSVRENSWHAGCWLHDVAGDLAKGFDTDLYPEEILHHCICVISRPASSTAALRWQKADGVLRQASLDEVHLAGLPRLAMGLRGLEAELTANATATGAGHDQGELLRNEAERLRKALEEAESGLKRANSALALRGVLHSVAAEARSELERRRSADAGTQATPASPHHAGPAFDLPCDTVYAHDDARLDRVAHVFHFEWFGIRAACGGLPGAKLGISANTPPTTAELVEIIDVCRSRGIRKLVLHGMSESMSVLAVALKRAGFDLYLVWHGAAAMWMWETERKLFELAAKLHSRGVLRGINLMRAGTDIVLEKRGAFRKQLLNVPPRVHHLRASVRRTQNAIAFSPSWNLLHKNLTTNLAAAYAAERVGTVWAMASDAVVVSHVKKKFVRLPARERAQMLQTMAAADVVLNVSIIDCHPMVDLEALAVGTPCIRGSLFLDALEDHPYVRATEVRNVLSVEALATTIDRVLAIPGAEMDAMIDDYRQSITRIALDRYVEFLELQ